MILKRIPDPLTVCKPREEKNIPSGNYIFYAKTDEEISLVCPTEVVPSDTTAREDGWRALRVEGVLDFSLIGILAKISGILAGESIGIFAVSTFNTDYILMKEEHFERGILALKNAGYEIR